MAWSRGGDTAATYPPLLSVMDDPAADERLLNEVAGFIWRLSTLSAAHLTDYIVNRGTVLTIGTARAAELTRIALAAGLLTEVTVDGRAAYKIIDDPEFIHLRLRDEVQWERQQRNDTRLVELKGAIMLRDGDCCRRCTRPVVWGGSTKNSRHGTVGHLVPREAATVDTAVVECMACNSSRRDDPAWDETHPLLPAPVEPFYGRGSQRYLREAGYMHPDSLTLTVAGEKALKRARHDHRMLAGDQPVAPAEQPTALAGDQPVAPAEQPTGTAPVVSAGVNRDMSETTGPSCRPVPGRVGTGREGTGLVRDGPGRDGAGLDGSGRQRDGARRRARRRTRGRRGRGRGGS